MVTIKTLEIKRFITAARHIRDTRILPIYGYVKLKLTKDGAVFYKSNSHSFLVCPVEAEYKKEATFIIEEATLFGFIPYCSGDEISIKYEGINIAISDGVKSVSCQGIEDNYPAIQAKDDGEVFDLDIDVISALHYAKAHVLPASDKAFAPWNAFVHLTKVGKEYVVAGFNGFTSYVQKFNDKLPSFVLDPETVSIVSKFSSATYTTAGNYDIFDAGGMTYGFIKPNAKVADLNIVLQNFSKAEKAFVVNRKKLLSFCEMVLDINNSAVQPEISINGSEEDSVALRYEGVSGQNASEDVFVNKKEKAFEKRIFNPKNIILSMKELSFDEVTISTLSENIIISSDEDKNYIGSIMSLSTL